MRVPPDTQGERQNTLLSQQGVLCKVIGTNSSYKGKYLTTLNPGPFLYWMGSGISTGHCVDPDLESPGLPTETRKDSRRVRLPPRVSVWPTTDGTRP